jgi:predicted dehydrogenase
MPKLRIGVFGAGRGKTMMSVLAKHPDATLVAVCDKHTSLLEEVRAMAERHGLDVALYEDFDAFFQHDMDAVVLANYANEHAPYAISFLRSGRHVLSEVLPCETMAQAVELIEAVEESGKVYAYAENYCYMQQTFEMWRRYENGDVGEVQYAEGEYIHDCSSRWPHLTWNDPNHWRNRMFSTFYCTHSLGPILAMTRRRPVQVVGFETPPHPGMVALGCQSGIAGGAVEMVTLDNGAVVKSIHGTLKREPSSVNFQLYGLTGMMETARFDRTKLTVYREGENFCEGQLDEYAPSPFIASDLMHKIGVKGHSGSDFFATHFFIEKILGRPDGEKYSIDVYSAVDMGICGILAYRSVLNGNAPVRVPNLRNKEERDAYRNDHACTNPAVAKEQLLPLTPHTMPEIPPEMAAKAARVPRD